jgi:hypothetical protein
VEAAVEALLHQPVGSLLLHMLESDFRDVAYIDRMKALGMIILVGSARTSKSECESSTSVPSCGQRAYDSRS